MRSLFSFFFLFFVTNSFGQAKANLTNYSFDTKIIQDDIQGLILKTGLKYKVDIRFSRSDKKNLVQLNCLEENMIFDVKTVPGEEVSAVYKFVEKMGFLFPHPRKIIYPKKDDIQRKCGSVVEWKPALKHRGFHFHTQHPNEWVHGFLMGKKKIIKDTLWWLTRNKQNIFQVVLLRQKKMPWKSLKYAYSLSHQIGLYMGASVSFNFQQQKSYKLLGFFYSFFNTEKSLVRELGNLNKNLDFDFLTIELGSSEFTSTSPEKTLKHINLAAKILSKREKQVFFKIHVSSNQYDKKWGNFNFLPMHGNKQVGILPHTVMFYGLEDKYTPMYGRRDFVDIKEFLLREKEHRPSWYFPETSYYIGLDIDIPLFLTDYIVARFKDMKFLSKHKVEGQINFTTGHEVGYWFFDWAVALYSDSEHLENIYSPLILLGEDPSVWKKIISFQTKWIKLKGIISMISSSNLLDEIPFGHKIHKRNLMKELVEDKRKTKREILLLENAIKELPFIDKVKSQELRSLLKVTWLRLHHALNIRYEILDKKRKDHFLKIASSYRIEAQDLINSFIGEFYRYPEAEIYSENVNPTSYQYGYGFTVKDLHYWRREEEMIKQKKFNPFFMNVYNIFDLLL